MAEEGMIEKTVNEDESYASFGIWGDKTYTVLPEIVAKFIGLITKNGGHITDNKVCLADLNDHGKTFTEIADLLETGEFWKENAPPTDTRTMID